MKVELHCHTNVSDGSSSFEELLEVAKRESIGHLAITNHDTTMRLQEMVERGKEIGIEIIPGIEVSGYDFARGRRVHILGYFVEPGHKALEDLCNPLIEKRNAASEKMVERLIHAGYRITWEQVSKFRGGTGVYKQHIMLALRESGYTDSIYGDLYKKIFSRGQNGEEPGIAFIPMEYVDAILAVKAIRAAGGVPVLAHPGQYGSFEIIPDLVKAGLEGIEVLHPHHGHAEEERAISYADQYNLIKTGDSDFHGDYGEKPIRLGSMSPGTECVNALKLRKKSMAINDVVLKNIDL
ncbi:PHP domain-containing protein [Peribacillus frigoritolerans]|uniref:PHP domain-containing protein n=1 Tax=Peribacillus frigoritolerans TaxID=450367 RepID=UPI000FD9EE7E|nr:PHP domain-containing protein [Peribacillus frigoritolerans]AZV63151.1 phosphatase [Peribacillus frigoritolerans]